MAIINALNWAVVNIDSVNIISDCKIAILLLQGKKRISQVADV